MGINSTEVAYAFGQHGSGHTKTATALYAPTGKVIVAITMLENIKFAADTGLLADTTYIKVTADAGLEDGVAYFGSAAQVLPNGEDDDGDAITSAVVAATVEFPKGVTIYGRWTRCTLSDTYTHGIIVYYGPK
mgnify:CR=1 FL=1|jgi:hypothetical protein